MKKTSKLVASLSLSLLAVGAIAQTNYAPKQTPLKSHMISRSIANSHPEATKKVTSGMTNGLLDYLDGDVNENSYTFWNGSSGNYTTWSPYLYINTKFRAADTVLSPLSSGSANLFTANSITVVYDTIWDYDKYLNTTVGYSTPLGGSVTVDTIWGIFRYHNTSNTNDTLIFNICGVTAAGMPSAAPLFQADTEIIPPHTTGVLPGTGLDSVFEVGFALPSGGLMIPSTAHGGWHFCVTASVECSKMDTLAFAYYSAFTQCSGNAYADSVTSLGAPNGASPHTNSFVTGLYWYNAVKDWKGSGTQVTYPIATPAANAGLWHNATGGQTFYNFQASGCPGFISYPPVQDIAMFCSISYTDVTGLKTITSNGLSVGQNYPNPFNKQTTITYNLTQSSDVAFTVCDITGRVVMTTNMNQVAPGQHVINLSANTLSPGIYFYTFDVNGSKVTRKMIITE